MSVYGPAMLFCPGDRPDRFDKAAQRADSVILDLEDAVAATHKDKARELVASALERLESPVVVRVNPSTTPWFEDDIAMLRASPVRHLMLPKAHSPTELDDLDDFAVIALCESAAGVLAARHLAEHSACAALMWGGEDLIADLGGRRSRDSSGRYYPVVEHARSSVLLAARAAGKVAIDSVHLDINDLTGLAQETADAVDVGFGAKVCIHPGQVATVRAAFHPTLEQVRWAHAVLAEAGDCGAVFQFEGQMIDEPLLRQARTVLSRAAQEGEELA